MAYVMLTLLVIVLILFVNWFLTRNVASTESFSSLQNPNEDDNLFEISRRALMDSYNSQVTAHGAYLLALAVALFAILSQWNGFTNVAYGEYLALFLIAFILSATVYSSLRIVFWAYLATDVLAINPTELVGKDGDASILRIHDTTIARFNQNSSYSRVSPDLAYFAGNKADIFERPLFIGGMALFFWFCLLGLFQIVKYSNAESKDYSLERWIGKKA